MAVTITRASVDDLQALAEINRLSYMRETTAVFAFKDWPDEKNMFNFFTARIKDRFDNADTQIFKAIDPRTEKILGFVCWTFQKGEEADAQFEEPIMVDKTPTAKLVEQMPPFLNLDFVISTGTEIEELKGIMRGEKHYCRYFFESFIDEWHNLLGVF
jgi:hypothetical protein